MEKYSLAELYTFFLAQNFPQKIKTTIINLIKEELEMVMMLKNIFTPSYNPWDQRVCLVPDSNLFRVIKNQKLSVVTDTIKQFETDGILMNSGKKLVLTLLSRQLGLNAIL